MIKVSIVIPVYNVEQYIAECIESVITQTYTNLEIIVVNDGSHDASGTICKEFAKRDNRIIYIEQPNMGPSAARNNGIDKATGEYIYFLDSDDMLVINAIEILLKYIQIENADCLFFDADVVNEMDKICMSENYYHRADNYMEVVSGVELLYQLLQKKAFRCSVPLMFIRKELFDNNKLRFFEKIIHEDELFAVQLLLCAKAVFHLPYRLYLRRVRKDSITTTKFSYKNLFGLSVVVENLLYIFYETHDSNAKQVLDYRINQLLDRIFSSLRKLSWKDIQKIRVKILEIHNILEGDDLQEQKEKIIQILKYTDNFIVHMWNHFFYTTKHNLSNVLKPLIGR